jgi:hypothetical protein
MISVISAVAARRAVTRYLRPVLVFIHDRSTNKWSVRNVGTGPALNILVAEKDQKTDPHKRFLRLPTLGKDSEISLRSAPGLLQLRTVTLRTMFIRLPVLGTRISVTITLFFKNLTSRRFDFILMFDSSLC